MESKEAPRLNDATPEQWDQLRNTKSPVPMMDWDPGSTVYTTSRLLSLHRAMTEECYRVMAKKNHDYTADGSVFANFEGSDFFEVHPVIGILMRSMDKFKRIETFVKHGTLKVEDDSLRDAFLDVINYMVLAYGYILENQD